SVAEPVEGRVTGHMFDFTERATAPSEESANVAFVAAHGARLVHTTGTLYVFQCESSITDVPTATFAAGDGRLVTSLPISSDGGSRSRFCTVRLHTVGDRVRAEARFGPE